MLSRKIASAVLAAVCSVGFLGLGATGAQAAGCTGVNWDNTRAMASCSGTKATFVMICKSPHIQRNVTVSISNGGQSLAVPHQCGSSKNVQAVLVSAR